MDTFDFNWLKPIFCRFNHEQLTEYMKIWLDKNFKQVMKKHRSKLAFFGFLVWVNHIVLDDTVREENEDKNWYEFYDIKQSSVQSNKKRPNP